jgi:hypothetical protein
MTNYNIDPEESYKLERYMNNLSEKTLKAVIKELYFFGELGHSTIKSMIDEFDEMFKRVN